MDGVIHEVGFLAYVGQALVATPKPNGNTRMDILDRLCSVSIRCRPPVLSRGRCPDKLLCTLQRRVNVWRHERVYDLVFGPYGSKRRAITLVES